VQAHRKLLAAIRFGFLPIAAVAPRALVLSLSLFLSRSLGDEFFRGILPKRTNRTYDISRRLAIEISLRSPLCRVQARGFRMYRIYRGCARDLLRGASYIYRELKLCCRGWRDATRVRQRSSRGRKARYHPRMRMFKALRILRALSRFSSSGYSSTARYHPVF